LTAHLERRADAALDAARAVDAAREVDAARRELDVRRAELLGREAALDQRARELDAQRADLDAASAEAARRLVDADREAARRLVDADREVAARREQAERDARAAAAAAARPTRPTPAPAVAPPAEPVTTPVRSLTEVPDEVTSPFELLSEIDAPELPPSADPITSTTADAARGPPPIRGSSASRVAPRPRRSRSTTPARGVALRATGASGAALTASRLDARLVVQRLPEYGVIVLLLGTPAALRGVGPAHRVLVPLDVAAELDRRFLATLERDFTLEIDVVVDGRPVRRARLTAPLTENVAFVVRAASDHLRTLGAAANFARGLVALGGVADVLGLGHPEHGEFRVDKLEPIATANQARRALAIARRFSKPTREDYLACVRSFPLGRWRELRHQVLARAVELGLWMGPELAQAAVSEGLARSRKDLLLRLDAGFQALLGQASANDLDADAIDDNRQALADEAAALGVAAGASAELEPVTSGIITPKQAAPVGVKGLPSGELVKLLEDRDRRLAAALELCERGDGAVARAVMNAARRMSRADAVRVLGAMVRLGPAAAATLTAGLSSSKAFLRHGCALALALLRTEEGTEAVVDALLGEPTEIWREIARAVGHVGPPALMPLAARLGRLGDRASASDRERIAWAMAHVGVRGGRHAVETLAGGQSAVAPVARMAIERMEPAASDDVSARAPVREVTVNRAFSRRFFEALERGLPELGKGELAALDASQPMELLDESDLLADDDADEELDESDLVDA
jgi:stage V sporulation protein SpoVS